MLSLISIYINIMHLICYKHNNETKKYYLLENALILKNIFILFW